MSGNVQNFVGFVNELSQNGGCWFPVVTLLNGSKCHQNSGLAMPKVILLHCALSLAAQCIVIGPVCGRWAGGVCGCVCGWSVSKLHASIFAKLDL